MLTTLLALAAVPSATACSCGSLGRTEAEHCERSRRAFAGTIRSYDWPHALEPGVLTPQVEIEVDQVWAGDVPATVTAWTGFGCCDCTIRPAPGTRIVYCDNGEGDESFRLSACYSPALGERANQVAAELGPGEAPGWSRPRLPDFMDLMEGVVTGVHATILSVPIALAGLAAALGRFDGRRPIPTRPRVAALATIVVIGLALVARLSHASMYESRALYFAPYALACAVAMVATYQAQRRPGAFGGRGRALLAGFAAPFLVLWLGYGRMHVPIDIPGAVACSQARADAILAALPADGLDEEALTDIPRTCMDWGLAPFHVSSSYWNSGVCLAFEDGDGGRWVTCRDSEGTRTDYGWDED